MESSKSISHNQRLCGPFISALIPLICWMWVEKLIRHSLSLLFKANKFLPFEFSSHIRSLSRCSPLIERLIVKLYSISVCDNPPPAKAAGKHLSLETMPTLIIKLLFHGFLCQYQFGDVSSEVWGDKSRIAYWAVYLAIRTINFWHGSDVIKRTESNLSRSDGQHNGLNCGWVR